MGIIDNEKWFFFFFFLFLKTKETILENCSQTLPNFFLKQYQL